MISIWSRYWNELLKDNILIGLLNFYLYETLLITLLAIFLYIFFIDNDEFGRHWYLPIFAYAYLRLGNSLQHWIIQIYWDLNFSLMGNWINYTMSFYHFFRSCFSEEIIGWSHRKLRTIHPIILRCKKERNWFTIFILYAQIELIRRIFTTIDKECVKSWYNTAIWWCFHIEMRTWSCGGHYLAYF